MKTRSVHDEDTLVQYEYYDGIRRRRRGSERGSLKRRARATLRVLRPCAAVGRMGSVACASVCVSVVAQSAEKLDLCDTVKEFGACTLGFPTSHSSLDLSLSLSDLLFFADRSRSAR